MTSGSGNTQRTGLRNPLRDGWQVSEELADAIVSQGETEAVRRALDRDDPHYWDEADRWIQDRFSARRSRPQLNGPRPLPG